MPATIAPLVIDWSHSTVFTTEVPSVVLNNAPPLTTIYTPPAECDDRWMVAGSDYLGSGITFGDHYYTGQPAVGGDTDKLTVWSVDRNPNFSLCRPYSAQPLYSPGVCPDGHTVAEITEFHARQSGDVRTSWVASCCRSGMTFGSDVVRYCISSISTSFRAQVMVTYSLLEQSNDMVVTATRTAYEPESTSWIGNTFFVYTLSNMTTITSALAIAAPYRVAWQIGDLNAFPSAYATSLAARIGVSAIPKASGGSDLPLETGGAQPKSSELSTAAKAGLGVGCGVGGVLIALGIFILWLRMRRKRTVVLGREASIQESTTMPEIEDTSGNAKRPMVYVGGKWRNEAHVEVAVLELEVPPQELGDTVRELEALAPELDSKTVHVEVETVAEPESSHSSKEWQR